MKEEFDEFFDSGVQTLNPTKEIRATIKVQPILVGRKAPNIDGYKHLQQENPKHRAMMTLSGEGHTNKEIAAILECHEVTVSNVLRAPLLQKNLAEIVNRTHTEDHRVVEIIKDNVVKAMQAFESALDGKDISDKQLFAAQHFLDRRYGKCNQPINRGNEVDLNSLTIAEVAMQLPPTDKTGTTP